MALAIAGGVAIQDTSATDRPLAKAVSRSWRRRISGAVIVLAALGGIAYVVRGWLTASRSVDASRIRIAKVERGTLVRDVVADGRVVAANSPTLYAIAAGTVDFHVRAGDKVTAGQLLATIASPELQSRLLQERATLVASADGFLTTIVPIIGGVTGDRNLSQLPLATKKLNDAAIAVFHADAMFATHGWVGMFPNRYSSGTIEIAIDGVPTYYLDDNQQPAPALTELSAGGGALFYGLLPGEAVLRTTVGNCVGVNSGWPTSAPGEIRVPVVAGQFTTVFPFCTGS